MGLLDLELEKIILAWKKLRVCDASIVNRLEKEKISFVSSIG